MPCTAGGAPVTMERLFGLVNEGTTQSPLNAVPGPSSFAMNGATPAFAASVR